MHNSVTFITQTLWWLIREYFQHPLGHTRSQNYILHGKWRVSLLKRRLFRNFIFKNKYFNLSQQRWIAMFAAAFVAILISCFLATGWPFNIDAQDPIQWLRKSIQPQSNGNNSGAWGLFTLISGSSIAFLAWYFRDKNNQLQIENNRKDINLKDFQKLAEWASGLHLIENKTTNSTKTTSDNDFHEITTTLETTTTPKDATLLTPTRRDGSAGLQIAAVVQLKAFLHGDFGKHFEKPAFTLLTSIWLGLTQKHVNEFDDLYLKGLTKSYKLSNERLLFNEWRNNFRRMVFRSPLAKAVTHALAAHNGIALREHKELLPGLHLCGVNFNITGLSNLQLDGLNLRGIQWQCADLENIELQGSNLRMANLLGANLRRAKLQDANFSNARMQGSILDQAEIQNANFINACMQGSSLKNSLLCGANMTEAKIQGANLYKAQMQNCSMYYANLQGSNLKYTCLNGANLKGIIIDENTRFDNAETNEKTIVDFEGSLFADPSPIHTHALRVKLQKLCGLKLPSFRYQEYLAEWNAASEKQKNQAMSIVGTEETYTDESFNID